MKSNIYYRENDDGGVLTCILAHSVPSSFCFYHTFKLYRLHFTRNILYYWQPKPVATPVAHHLAANGSGCILLSRHALLILTLLFTPEPPHVCFPAMVPFATYRQAQWAMLYESKSVLTRRR